MDEIERLVADVQAGGKYRAISVELVRRVAAAELAKGRSYKETLKAVRAKLHQVGAVYQSERMQYAAWRAELAGLSRDLHDPAALDFCQRVMAQHASTRERLPILGRFFHETLAALAPVSSVLDVACGLNPLALAWMPAAADVTYTACDVYTDMVAFLNEFFAHFGVRGEAFVCDLTAAVPDAAAQVVFALKTLPCLEQLDKGIGARLLGGLKAEHALVSFPARSLGGHSKGMPQFYEQYLMDALAGQAWELQRKIEYPSEIGFLLSKASYAAETQRTQRE